MPSGGRMIIYFEVGFKSGIKPSIVFDVTMLVTAVVVLLGSLFIPGNGLFWPTIGLAAIIDC